MKKFVHIGRRNALPLLIALIASATSQYCYSQATAMIKTGNGYVNVTKRTVGGTVTNGDTLEIRTTFYINGSYNSSNSGTNGGVGRIYSVRFLDSLPLRTDTITSSTLRRITNEGIQSRSYTLTANDDAGTFTKNPVLPNIYQIRVNLGGPPFGVEPTRPTNGQATTITDIVGSSNMQGNSNWPLFGGGTLTTVAYRVRVTGSAGDSIILASAKIIYKKTNGGADTTINFTRYKILISAANSSFCANQVGANFVAEAGGTFDSGAVLNRVAGPTYPIPGYTYINNVSRSVSINDGYYAIVKNLSPINGTNVNARRTGAGGGTCTAPSPIAVMDSCTKRMFGGFWFISGDHTGTNNSTGKAPPAAVSSSGYMLVVNADVSQSEAYRQTIAGLCPDTYYEFSAWVKNICPLCGIDSAGSQTWKPGVLPNLTFVLDGRDVYSTGDLDTLGWLKRGFTFKTDTAQSSVIISIRNNAPGGGGNDWAIDDIQLATCNPDIAITPGSGVDSSCVGNSITFTATVTSSFNNLNYWRWEKSNTGAGGPWSTVSSGNTTPTWNGTAYDYTINLTISPTTAADSGDLFRAVFASTFANLSSASCRSISNSILLVVRTTYNPAGICKVLPVKVVNLTARKENDKVKLVWNTEGESPNVLYEIERSNDGNYFGKIGSQSGYGQEYNQYTTYDNNPYKGTNYYRLKVIDLRTAKIFYSQIVVIQIDNGKNFDLISIINPFKDQLYITIATVTAGTIKMTLNSLDGRTVSTFQQNLSRGMTQVQFNKLSNLPSGIYILRMEMEGQTIIQKVYKTK